MGLNVSQIISIPQGTIKSWQKRYAAYLFPYISIPQGTIKRGFLGRRRRRRYKFQFHKVRLKVFMVNFAVAWIIFQFHKVRLKEWPGNK